MIKRPWHSRTPFLVVFPLEDFSSVSFTLHPGENWPSMFFFFFRKEIGLGVWLSGRVLTEHVKEPGFIPRIAKKEGALTG